ncbi:MAG: PSD1 and planctomycete cytochrome C domain-containing protein [Chthoniobacteraceae bacterium]
MRKSIILLALGSTAFAAADAPLTSEQTEFFESKVRPILSAQCYKCHSLEENKVKGGLSLDTKNGWQKGGDSGAVIEPGHPEKSLLITAIGYKDADLQMPPKGEKLSDEQIAVLTKWVKMGAPDPRVADEATKTKLTGLTDSARHHWAYLPVVKPAVPTVKNANWCKTPIDAYIAQGLEANGMVPNKQAGKEALIRRAYYDLIGLPPTPYEVADFIKDQSPDAFAKVVNKLLASPHYGERWGRHWLDTARYSDTKGGERNARRETEYRFPNAWTYRDYVVKAFNDDKPYDQFVIEQLAADQLPNVKDGDPRLAALGFLTVGERFRSVNDVINDRIDVVGKGLLGLTVSCARCHDHMFDPIPTRDYYALHGVFASVIEPDHGPVLAMSKKDQFADYQEKFNAAVKEMQSRYYGGMEKFLVDFWQKPEPYLQAALTFSSKGKGSDADATKERNKLISKHDLHPQFVQFLARGLAANPGVWAPLYELKQRGKFDVADFAKRGSEMSDRLSRKISSTKGEEKGKYGRMPEQASSRGANKFVLEAMTATPPTSVNDAVKIYAALITAQKEQAKGMFAAVKNATSSTVDGFDQELIDLLRGPFVIEPASVMTRDAMESSYLSWPNQIQGRANLNFGEINLLEITHPGAPAKAMVLADKPNPKDSPIFIRGESQSRGPIAPRGFLEVLSPDHKPIPFTQGSGRLDLAKAIADKGNPLTARVAMNRLWMHHFGEGLVTTPDDLGVMAGKPSHPELLDYLSAKFMESGWSMKTMHKIVMLSAVYQQSTETNKAYETKDPMNHLLWRANIRRLDFESMRDSLLVFSGQLEKTIGGKPVNLTDEPYSYRRSVYGYVDRGNLPELMQNFDFSDPDMPNSKRTTTVVPQQALFLMNSSMAVDISRKIAARPEIVKATSTDEKVRWMYRIMFQRMPSAQEMSIARSFIQEVEGTPAVADVQPVASASEKSEKSDKKSTKGFKPKRSDPNFGPIQNQGETVERRPQTAWEAYAQALLFANELAYVN